MLMVSLVKKQGKGTISIANPLDIADNSDCQGDGDTRGKLKNPGEGSKTFFTHQK